MRGKKSTVAEKLEHAHRELLENLRQLDEEAALVQAKRQASLVLRLEKTRADVTEHFRLEEKGGYMEAVRKHEPRLVPTIDKLAQEHRELAQALDSLCVQARAANAVDDVFREALRRWVARLHGHEQRENEVMQAVYNQDVAAED